MKLGNKEIGQGHAPFFIAEMSGNHNHSLEKALAIVDAAADAGADALKIQTYTPDTMTIDHSEGEFFIKDKKSLWEGKSLYELYTVAMTPWDWHEPIARRCKERGLIFFSTPFDDTAVDFLEKMNVPFYKIASFENNHLPLIRKVAKTGKPMIVSTGMASLDDIGELVEAAKSAGCKDLVLLKCTSSYPARPEEANLATIPDLRERFKVEIGLSDHTMGWTIPVAASVLGVSVIEKHFTIKRSDGGVDSAFSMEPSEFKQMIHETKLAVSSFGKIRYGLTEDEKRSSVFRRSIYFVKDINAGETITDQHIRIIRPGLGLSPKHYEEVLGKKAKVGSKRGTPVKFDFLT